MPYNILLGRPWIHERKAIPSTLHQCLKYEYEGQTYNIQADKEPFKYCRVIEAQISKPNLCKHLAEGGSSVIAPDIEISKDREETFHVGEYSQASTPHQSNQPDPAAANERDLLGNRKSLSIPSDRLIHLAHLLLSLQNEKVRYP